MVSKCSLKYTKDIHAAQCFLVEDELTDKPPWTLPVRRVPYKFQWALQRNIELVLGDSVPEDRGELFAEIFTILLCAFDQKRGNLVI